MLMYEYEQLKDFEHLVQSEIVINKPNMGICLLVLKYTHLRTVQDYEKSAQTNLHFNTFRLQRSHTDQPIYFISITLYLF